MKSRLLFSVLILLVTLGALVMRLPRLAQRPMHTDEAVHAIKFGDLLEKGIYKYDPYEFHGPTLYYLTLVTARLRCQESISEVDETTLRLVPVIFGIGLVLLFALLGDGLGRWAAICGGVLAALSPALVFYSRYYIHETLLVCFSFLVIAAGWRYSLSRKWSWALLAGAAPGLMHATKETCIIAFASMVTALVLIIIWRRLQEKDSSRFRLPIKRWHLMLTVAAAIVVSVLLFSSFLTNAQGPIDSIKTYANYFDRADGRVIHVHRWYYYLKMLTFSRYGPGPSWSEGLIIFLALAGLLAGIMQKGIGNANVWLIRFIAIYTVLMTIIYSAIPYKTPWCMLGFLHGMIILAGVGAVALVRMIPGQIGKIVLSGLLLATSFNLGSQAYKASYKYYADTRNPYVYGHTSTSLVQLAGRVEDIAQVHPQGHNMHIQVITQPDDYWPLPWYLRKFRRVGYHTEIPDVIDAAVVITSTEMQPMVEKKLSGSYQSDVYGLRHSVLLNVYIKQCWWDAFIEQRQTIK